MKRLFLVAVAFALAACTPAPTTATKETVAAPVAAPAAAPPAPPQLPLIGMLEDRPGSAGGPARFAVRVLFQKDGDTWKSLNPGCSDETCLAGAPARLPSNAAWTLVHGGKTMGVVRAETPAAWKLYSDIGTQELANGSLIRTVGDRTRLFSADGHTPLYRPLVVTSIPAASDPDAWKPEKLPPDALAALRVAFRTQFNDVQNCTRKGGTAPRPMTYADDAIVVSGIWNSTRSWTIATARLKDYRCDGPLDGTAFAPQTYVISPEGKVEHLGESLRLVDAGDFDGDGKSELIFAISTYNTGGYDLRFNDFAGQATFAFSYH